MAKKKPIQFEFKALIFYVAGRKGCDMNRDRLIRRMAKSHKGSEIGSGMGFGERDFSFSFKARPDAKAFVAEIERKKLGDGEVIKSEAWD